MISFSKKSKNKRSPLIKFILRILSILVIFAIFIIAIHPSKESSLGKKLDNLIHPSPTHIVNDCNKNLAQFIPNFPQSYYTGENKDINKIPTKTEVKNFESWASEHQIILIGTQSSFNKLNADRYYSVNDTVPLENIRGLMYAYVGLQSIPDSILEIMRNKAIYFSTVNDTINHALYTQTDPEIIEERSKENKYVIRDGLFLTQPITTELTVHEVGHLVGTIGIKGKYGENYNNFNDALSEYRNLFVIQGLENLPCGYISEYSTKNEDENFADHFAYYITKGSEFRKRAMSDSLLSAKYNFFKKYIFEGKEY